jgi:hypothetical protein
MKTIEVSDKDYEILMALSKELQTQDNHGQAFPYFWEPSSYKQEMNPHGEGQDVKVYYDTELYGFLDFAEYDDFENYNKFLKEKKEWEFDEDEDDKWEYNFNEYYPDLEDEWKDYIDDDIDDAEVYTFDWNRKQEHNPSIFLTDVQNYIKNNKHLLGRKPHTYANTAWRMPKMKNLMECLLRLNKNVPKECVNHEALRFRENI